MYTLFDVIFIRYILWLVFIKAHDCKICFCCGFKLFICFGLCMLPVCKKRLKVVFQVMIKGTVQYIYKERNFTNWHLICLLYIYFYRIFITIALQSGFVDFLTLNDYVDLAFNMFSEPSVEVCPETLEVTVLECTEAYILSSFNLTDDTFCISINNRTSSSF